MEGKAEWFFSLKFDLFDIMLSPGEFWFELLGIRLAVNLYGYDSTVTFTFFEVFLFGIDPFTLDIVHLSINDTAYGIGYRSGRSFLYKERIGD